MAAEGEAKNNELFRSSRVLGALHRTGLERSQPRADGSRFRRTDRRHRSEAAQGQRDAGGRSEEHTSELQSLMRISYAVFCLTKKQKRRTHEKGNTDKTDAK